MRIRKRQVPLAFSSLSSVPLSDPLLNHRSLLVQLQTTPTTTTTTTSNNNSNNTLSPQRPTDHLPPPIGDSLNKDRLELLKDVEGGGQDDGGERAVNESTRICSSRLAFPMADSSSTTSLQVRRWGDMGEKAFPFKKRRGSFEKRSSASSSSTSNNVAEKDKKVLSSSSKARTVKTKMSKKFVDEESDVVIDEEKSIDDDGNNDAQTKEGDGNSAVEKQTTNGGGAKNNKRNRGGTLMEGSRCSRVNGRGWRCCQQTLVGYSLCEHHLGKGRLRSMTSVRSRSVNHHHSKQPVISSNNINPGMSSKSKSTDDDGGEGDNEGENKKNVAMITKNNNKKMKLGVVKARSMSSLLGQEHIRDATNAAYGSDVGNNNDEYSKELVIKREGECENNA